MGCVKLVPNVVVTVESCVIVEEDLCSVHSLLWKE